MKNHLVYLVATWLLCVSCSSGRLTILEPEKAANLYDKFSAKVPESVLQEKQNLKANRDYQQIKTALGNSIFFTKGDFKPLKNGKEVEYPIDLDVIELMSIKDIILHKKPTVSKGKLLTTDGQIYVKAYKDGEELFLRDDAFFVIEMKGMSGKVDPEMELFLGNGSDDDFDWSLDSSGIERQVGGNSNEGGDYEPWRYLCYPARLGWINIDKFAEYDKVTTVSFKTVDIDIEKVNIDLYFPEINSVIRYVYGGKLSGVPLGMKATVIAYSIEDEGKSWVADIQDITITENLEVEITLKETTKEIFMGELEKLGR